MVSNAVIGTSVKRKGKLQPAWRWRGNMISGKSVRSDRFAGTLVFEDAGNGCLEQLV
jgi:hypothetical protein